MHLNIIGLNMHWFVHFQYHIWLLRGMNYIFQLLIAVFILIHATAKYTLHYNRSFKYVSIHLRIDFVFYIRTKRVRSLENNSPLLTRTNAHVPSHCCIQSISCTYIVFVSTHSHSLLLCSIIMVEIWLIFIQWNI